MKFYAVLCCAIIATYTHDPWGFGHKLHIVTHSFSTGWFYGKVEEVNKGLVGIKNNGKGSIRKAEQAKHAAGHMPVSNYQVTSSPDELERK